MFQFLIRVLRVYPRPILLPSGTVALSNWPDSGLSRNTRCRCYRCSVPGLAGFARQTLCGARSLITFQKSNLRLAMRQQAKQAVDAQM